MPIKIIYLHNMDFEEFAEKIAKQIDEKSTVSS